MRTNWILLLLLMVGCSRSLPVSATYRGLPEGLGDPVRQKLGATVTGSLKNAVAEKDEEHSLIKVSAVPAPETLAALKSAGFAGLGPCLPDLSTYSYFVARLYDKAGQLLAVSQSADAPVTCRKGNDYVFSTFEKEKIEISFPANATILRDTSQVEFSAWFEPRADRGTVETNINNLPPSWRIKSQQTF